MAKAKPTAQRRREAIERLKHIAWAGLIALVMQVLTLPGPVDQLLWTGQARVGSFEATGDIAFIGAREDISDPSFPARREQLATLIEQVDAAGAKEIYVDILFDQPGTTQSDSALNAALRATQGRASLAKSQSTGLNGVDVVEKFDPGNRCRRTYCWLMDLEQRVWAGMADANRRGR